MTVETRFWDALRDRPDARQPLLDYAEWLRRRGDRRADLVGIQAELDCPIDSADYCLLKAREQILCRQLRSEILGSLRKLTKRVTFHRGLVIPEMTAAQFHQHAAEVTRRSPTLGIRFTDMRNWQDGTELSKLRAVNLQGNSRQSDRVAFLQSAHLTGLRTLNPGPAVARSEFGELLLSGHWPFLERVSLEGANSFNLKDVLCSPSASGWKHLELGYNGAGALSAFAADGCCPSLETLQLGSQASRHGDLPLFCRDAQLPFVRSLEMSSTFVKPESLADLLQNRSLGSLESLAVLCDDDPLPPELFALTPPPRLRRLSLRQCQFTKNSAAAFGESALLAQLESLRITPGNLGRFLAALSVGSCPLPLRSLQLANVSPSSTGLERFGNSGRFANLESLVVDCSASAALALCKVDFPKLRRLDIETTLSRRLLRALVAAPWFDRIHTLGLRGEWEDGAFQTLASSPSPNLRVLVFLHFQKADASLLSRIGGLENLEYLAVMSTHSSLARQDRLNSATTRKLKQRFGSAFEEQSGGVTHAMGGLAPIFFAKHPFAGII